MDIAGFIPAFLSPSVNVPSLDLDGSHGLLFGLFVVNWVHNLFQLAIGILGIAAHAGCNRA